MLQHVDARTKTLRFRILRMLVRNQREHYFTHREICTALNEHSGQVLLVTDWLRSMNEVRLVRRATVRDDWSFDTTAEGIAAFVTEDVLFNRFMSHLGGKRKY